MNDPKTQPELKEFVEQMLLMNNEFQKQALILIALSTKVIFNHEEAAAFLGVKPNYLYQLNHSGAISPIEGKGKKKNYYRKEDLENYLLTGKKADDIAYENFEREIENEWSKKKQ